MSIPSLVAVLTNSGLLYFGYYLEHVLLQSKIRKQNIFFIKPRKRRKSVNIAYALFKQQLLVRRVAVYNNRLGQYFTEFLAALSVGVNNFNGIAARNQRLER